MKIIKGDNVLVISGKDRAKTGKVLRAIPVEERVVVDGVNIAKKSQKPRQRGQKGQVVSMPKSISVSNVKLICPKCGKATRVGYKVTEEKEGEASKKSRVCKKCLAEI
jgi:large subunit ribosomal protein L24